MHSSQKDFIREYILSALKSDSIELHFDGWYCVNLLRVPLTFIKIIKNEYNGQFSFLVESQKLCGAINAEALMVMGKIIKRQFLSKYQRVGSKHEFNKTMQCAQLYMNRWKNNSHRN